MSYVIGLVLGLIDISLRIVIASTLLVRYLNK